MAIAFVPIPVPKFSPNHLALAEVCATEIWNGYDYQSGKASDISDEDLLLMFSVPTFIQYKNAKTTRSFTELEPRELIRAARLKALFRSNQPTDFQSAIASYRTTAFAIYKQMKQGKPVLAHPYDYATQAILSWSVKFVSNPNVSLNGNHRVPLACRILFFAMPDMMVFNYSNGLSKAMRFQKRPQAAIPNFNKYLYEGLILNFSLIKELKMPEPKSLPEEVWLAANQGGWWHRRVLDLALLLHFNLVTATPQLQTKGRQLAAQWAATKKAKP